jgi:CubicO group peptidase (beta-lactamase class C family)
MTRRAGPFVALILVSVTAAPPLFGQSLEGGTSGDALAVSADRVFGDLGVDGSPGCAVGAVEQGHWVLKRAYGHANLDWGTPITSNTVFYAGSVSKQFTAAAIVLLEQDGKLSLNDPIQALFPEFDDWPRTLTLRHLIHHTSGVPDLYRVMDKHGLSTWDRFSPDQAVALLANEPLDFEPGEQFSYSNGGYLLLSQVVLRASGQSLRAFTDARIFGPLGMLDTHFHDDPMHVVPRRAMSYGPAEDGGFQQTYEGNFALPGAGGLYTSVDDFIRWDENFTTGAVGGPEFASIMSQRGVLNSGEQLDYAFAQRHGARGGTRLIDHTGSFMGFKAYYVRFPDEGRSMWAFCNYGPLTPRDLALQVADSWMQQW